MVRAVKSLSIAARALAIMAMLAILAGCGSSAPASASLAAEVSEGGSECPKTVLQTIGSVLMRVYHEGVESERTAAAKHLIETSKPLLEAWKRAMRRRCRRRRRRCWPPGTCRTCV